MRRGLRVKGNCRDFILSFRGENKLWLSCKLGVFQVQPFQIHQIAQGLGDAPWAKRGKKISKTVGVGRVRPQQKKSARNGPLRLLFSKWIFCGLYGWKIAFIALASVNRGTKTVPDMVNKSQQRRFFFPDGLFSNR